MNVQMTQGASRYTKALAIGVSAIAVGMAMPAAAQDDTGTESAQQGRNTVFGEIVVTATKREEQVQDVAISITAIGGDQLEALGYTSAQQVTALAPGVSTIQPNGEANYSLAIRGAANSDFTTNVESPVALYVDEVYISQSSGSGFALFDTERVEILRGPQGTLFGRNATGGLAHFISVKPKFETSGYVEAGYGSFDTFEAEGAFNFALGDTVATRVSLATTQGDGYVTNRLNPEKKLNNSNDIAGRVQLLWEPSDTFNALLNVRFGDENIRTGFFEYVSAPLPTGAPQPDSPNPQLGGYVDLDGDVYAGAYDRQGHNDLETFGTTLTLNAEFGDVDFVSITDYQTVKRDYIEDSDASPADHFNFFLTTDAEQYSQEFRISGETDSFEWVAGLYYLHIGIDDSNGAIAPGFLDALFGLLDPSLIGVANGIRNPYSQDVDSYSGFGQVDWHLNDQLTLTLGGRYIVDKKDFAYADQLVLYPAGADSGADPGAEFIADLVDPYTDKRTDKMWAARAQLTYEPNSDLLLYAGYNRGVRGGGFNAPLLPTATLVTTDFLSYAPEELNAFEGGFKYSFPSGIGRINGSAYYYDYNNFQAFSIIGLDTFTLNADSKNYGFELEAFLNPVSGLDIGMGVGYINTDVTNVPGVTDDIVLPDMSVFPAILPDGVSAIPVQTPEWNLSGLVRYEAGIPSLNGAIAFQSDFQYRSKHYFN
ncbi:TonB-dependent receptor [Erythrobacteraceae bacterium E2-1 Yellow Sea]|nr:TonB-dependent receptor [Erythrobacteraceae bacterium E2-1 Yellow Sea]